MELSLHIDQCSTKLELIALSTFALALAAAREHDSKDVCVDPANGIVTMTEHGAPVSAAQAAEVIANETAKRTRRTKAEMEAARAAETAGENTNVDANAGAVETAKTTTAAPVAPAAPADGEITHAIVQKLASRIARAVPEGAEFAKSEISRLGGQRIAELSPEAVVELHQSLTEFEAAGNL